MGLNLSRPQNCPLHRHRDPNIHMTLRNRLPSHLRSRCAKRFGPINFYYSAESRSTLYRFRGINNVRSSPVVVALLVHGKMPFHSSHKRKSISSGGLASLFCPHQIARRPTCEGKNILLSTQAWEAGVTKKVKIYDLGANEGGEAFCIRSVNKAGNEAGRKFLRVIEI